MLHELKLHKLSWHFLDRKKAFGFRRDEPVNLAKERRHRKTLTHHRLTLLRARSSFVDFGSERHVNMNDLRIERC